MARIAIAPMGSWGDLFPLMATAEALEEHGNAVSFVVDPGYAGLVRSEGFEVRTASPVADRDQLLDQFDRLHLRRPASGDQLLARLLGSADLTRQLIDGFRGADLAAFPSYYVAARTAAEVVGLPWITLTASPEFALRETWLGAAGWQRYLARMRRHDPAFNRVRREFGLEPERDLFALRGFSDRLVCMMASPVCVPRPPGWPEHFKLAGFADWDRPKGWAPPPALAGFLAGGEPPVILSLRPKRRVAGRDLIDVALRALDRLGRRAIVLTGLPFGVGRPDKQAEGEVITSRLAAWDYVPLSLLLPDAAALIHHGGLGSMASAIRAGRPALVLPAIADQHFNAQRTVELGVGRSLDLRQAGIGSFAEELDALLADLAYSSRARLIGEHLAAEDGGARAAGEITAVLRQAG